MGVVLRFLAVAAMGALATNCTTSTSEQGWSSEALFGTTPLGNAYADFLSARYAGMVNDPDAAAEYYTSAWRQAQQDSDLLDRAVVSNLLAGDAVTAGRIAKSADKAVLASASFASLAAVADDVAGGRRGSALSTLENTDLGAMSGIGLAVRSWLIAQRSPGRALDLLELEAGQSGALGGFDICLRALILAADDEREAALEAFDRGFAVCSRSPVLAAAHLRVAYEQDGADAAQALLARLPAPIAGSVEVAQIAAALEAGGEVEPLDLNMREGAALGLYLASRAAGAGASGQLGAVFFQMMHHMDPGSELALIQLADAHFSLDRYEAAASYAARVPPESPYADRALWEHARALIAQERNDEALGELRVLVSRDLDHELALRAGDAFRLLDAQEEAAQVYSRLIGAVERGDADWRPLLGRAAAYNELDQWASAEADLLAALEIDPDQPEVLNFLGYGWIDQGVNVEAGFDLIRRAIRQRPRSGHIVDSLGWAHFRLGEYDEAVRQLERAAELAPGDAEIIDHLGDAYWRAGRELEAGFEWRRALTLDPEQRLANLILEKLEVGLEDDVAGDLADATAVQQ